MPKYLWYWEVESYRFINYFSLITIFYYLDQIILQQFAMNLTSFFIVIFIYKILIIEVRDVIFLKSKKEDFWTNNLFTSTLAYILIVLKFLYMKIIFYQSKGIDI